VMRSLRWKLILMAVVIVFIPVYLLNRYAILFFDRYTRTDFEMNMRHYAYIIGEQYKLEKRSACSDEQQELFNTERAQLFTRIGREINARICLFGRDGSLLYDSDCGRIGDSLAGRAEVAEALKGGYCARARLSEDRRLMYYYIAQPIKDEQKNMLGVVYVVAHTNPIVQAIQRMVANQRLATYIALASAGMVALILALTMTRRLRRLTRETKAFAAGGRPLGRAPRGGDEIAELGRSIHSMAEDIESRNVYNRDFIQTTLHELKTPMTAIRGAAEVLGSLDEQGEMGVESRETVRRKFLSKIDFQVERLMRLVGELRELTLVDVEMSQAVREDIDYCRFVRDAVVRLEEIFAEPHAELSVELPENELRVSIVPGRIEQVLANLLDNAFRYTLPSGKVVVRVAKVHKSVITTVEDSGCGIVESNIERVFDRFFTTERRQQPRDYGSGLGLAIVASIIRSHQGEIRVESEPGRGARFIFDIPCL